LVTQVYGFENREKVREDEEKFAAQERLKEGAEVQVQRDTRRQLLLGRARTNTEGDNEGEDAPTSASHIKLFEVEEEAATLEV
jgi:hypothetical protein